MLALLDLRDGRRLFEDILDEQRSYFPLSPAGGEGQGEGAVVTERTRIKRVKKAQQRRNAKQLRVDQTDAERNFWYNVRGRGLGGFKFRRQYPIGPYIADFVCLEARFVVELDGGQHAEAHTRLYDDRRTAYLESKGFRVRRFWNVDVLTNMAGVLEALFHEIQSVGAPSP
jgi:very-short-patch-repair endonuclease